FIGGSGTNSNVVIGNFIGTDVTGTAALGNGDRGVTIIGGAQSNTIGGTTAGERNIISGNGNSGVEIDGAGTDNNKVSGNYIGTDVNGTADLGNGVSGVIIWNGPQGNTIGGTTAGERNIISGNDQDGVGMGLGTNNNTVSGNYIGTDVTGTVDLGNTIHGVVINFGAQGNTIGGTTAGERNIISGNDQNGIGILDSGTNSNVVIGNFIGTDVTGTAALGNLDRGVSIGGGAQSNTIGGTTSGERNVVSGNDRSGVLIIQPGTDNNVVIGNYIGIDVTGTAALGNGWEGVIIWDGPQGNTIGGTTSGERNIISGNSSTGVRIAQPGTDNNVVIGNYIGIVVTGTAALGNTHGGVDIYGGAQSNTIGGTTAGERNIISGNSNHGVLMWGSGTNGNVVSGNYIGTDVNGTADLGNASCGVSIWDGPQSNTIGGTRNTIAFNGGNGVEVNGEETDFNKISQNSMHDNVGMGIDLVNGGNDEIAPPNITSNSLADDILTVSGDSAGADATVEIFKADASTQEGEVFLGSLTADADGNFIGALDVTGKRLFVGAPLAATTTHTNNNTSELVSLRFRRSPSVLHRSTSAQ
ncbi:hypothetical protein H8E77_30645, partial [bacterium]|nr:hypothetical protein [bacterium]